MPDPCPHMCEPPPRPASPKVLKPSGSEECDMWAWGVIMWEMCCSGRARSTDLNTEVRGSL